MPGQMYYQKQGGPLVPINPGPIGPKGDPGEQGPQGDGKPPHIGADEPTDTEVVEWFDTDDPGQPYVTRVTHPNQSDTLVEAWDGNVWVVVS